MLSSRWKLSLVCEEFQQDPVKMYFHLKLKYFDTPNRWIERNRRFLYFAGMPRQLRSSWCAKLAFTLLVLLIILHHHQLLISCWPIYKTTAALSTTTPRHTCQGSRGSLGNFWNDRVQRTHARFDFSSDPARRSLPPDRMTRWTVPGQSASRRLGLSDIRKFRIHQHCPLICWYYVWTRRIRWLLITWVISVGNDSTFLVRLKYVKASPW